MRIVLALLLFAAVSVGHGQNVVVTQPGLSAGGSIVVTPPSSPTGAPANPFERSPYADYDAAIDAVWPVLPDHPSPTNIPPDGMSYRLGEGTNITWWVVRQGDLVATQISAHDSQGRAIIRTRRLRTGAESVIPIEEISIDPAVMSTVRSNLRVVKSSLSTNEADAKAIVALTNGFTAAETRAAVNSLRRELIDLIADVQVMRREQSRQAKELTP